MKPRLLDLFCGAGGCTASYQRAGFYVVGVDLHPQPNYCGDEFVQEDALDFLRSIPWDCYPAMYDAIHASPPCQAHSSLKSLWKDRTHPDLIGPTRDLLERAALPYVIENVVGAPVPNAITLCGSAFGLGANGRQLRRHRLFECSFPVMSIPCQHRGQPVGVYGHGGGGSMTRGYKGSGDEYRDAMDIHWGATKAEIAQAIPPAYTEHIGHYLLTHIRQEAKAA